MTNEELLAKIERAVINSTPNPQLNFEVHIVDQCNLNCKQCSHFAPLAEDWYIDIKDYQRDCERLSELFHGEMLRMNILGGEPLLHPQIVEIMKITRTNFPVGMIAIETNGILLPSMPEEFWEACKIYDVDIDPTYYPIKFDYAEYKKIAEEKGVRYTSDPLVTKRMNKMFPICLRNPNNAVMKSNFLRCPFANQCITLKNGRLYPCMIAAHAVHLKKYFNLNITLSEEDSVDIYSVKTKDELMEKIAKPIPFCRYCDVVNNFLECDWGVSHKNRYEWLAFEFTEEDIKYLRSEAPAVYVFGAGKWGKYTVAFLKNAGIPVKAVLVTRTHETDTLLDVPIVTLNDIGEVEEKSICLVALASYVMKDEVYPQLSKIGFGDVVPVSGISGI